MLSVYNNPPQCEVHSTAHKAAPTPKQLPSPTMAATHAPAAEAPDKAPPAEVLATASMQATHLQTTAPLEPDPVEMNGDRLLRRCTLEKIRLVKLACDCPCQCPCLGASSRVQLAELRHGLLDDLAVATHGTNQAPVRVHLAILASSRMPQIHALLPRREYKAWRARARG